MTNFLGKLRGYYDGWDVVAGFLFHVNFKYTPAAANHVLTQGPFFERPKIDEINQHQSIDCCKLQER